MSYLESDVEKACKRKFRNLSTEELIKLANSLPDFMWDDEECEINRRVKVSNGKLIVKMIGNELQIV